jgi:hypothetical protein
MRGSLPSNGKGGMHHRHSTDGFYGGKRTVLEAAIRYRDRLTATLRRVTRRGFCSIKKKITAQELSARHESDVSCESSTVLGSQIFASQCGLSLAVALAKGSFCKEIWGTTSVAVGGKG